MPPGPRSVCPESVPTAATGDWASRLPRPYDPRRDAADGRELARGRRRRARDPVNAGAAGVSRLRDRRRPRLLPAGPTRLQRAPADAARRRARRHPRPGSLPRPRPGDGPLLLRPGRRDAATVAPQHLRRARHRPRPARARDAATSRPGPSVACSSSTASSPWRRARPPPTPGKGWEPFTDRVIAELSGRREGIVFLLWGRYAQQKGAIVDTRTTPRARPRRTRRRTRRANGFFGCRHFSRANALLEADGREPVDWRLGDLAEATQGRALPSNRGRAISSPLRCADPRTRREGGRAHAECASDAASGDQPGVEQRPCRALGRRAVAADERGALRQSSQPRSASGRTLPGSAATGRQRSGWASTGTSPASSTAAAPRRRPRSRRRDRARSRETRPARHASLRARARPDRSPRSRSGYTSQPRRRSRPQAATSARISASEAS